jgi:hypothetical protein
MRISSALYALAAFLLSFAVGAAILGSQVSSRVPNIGYQSLTKQYQ